MPTSDGVMRDLVTRRLDLAILDPALVELAIRQNPGWSLHQVPLDPDPAFPIMSTKYNATMAVRKEATHLAAAINAEIGELWEACTNQRILARYGVTNPTFFLPPDPNLACRRGPTRGLGIADAQPGVQRDRRGD